MAVMGRHDDDVALYVCVYAPHQKGPREAFYWGLADLELPTRSRVLLGGDFNCTLDSRLDRTHYRQHSDHTSPGLEALLMNWGLSDAVTAPLDTDSSMVASFHEQAHTYRYTLPSGVQASARLDRWYTSADLVDWVAQVDVCHPGARADHQAVRLHLVNPHDPIRVRKPARVYPPPPVAAAQVHAAMSARLTDFHGQLQTTSKSPSELAHEWEETKTAIRIDALRIIKQRRKTARASYKQKCRRLIRQERRILDAIAGAAHTVETITDGMEALTLVDGRGDSPLTRVRNAITDCMRGRMALRQKRLFRQSGFRTGSSTKQFFRRISTKYADTAIHRLDAAQGFAERGVHGQPDTMADAWTAIFQQVSGTEEDRQRVLRWLGDPGQYTELLADIIEPISELEVAAAIGASKTGKACGPDRLGNDWYRDFANLLTPVLTILLNSWYSGGVVPPSFLEADIFCLKKGGVSQNPLNFRPLSLMNSDYKLLTRILTTRASQKLAEIIHPNQNGFVPTRTIHATLDLFAAAQVEAERHPELAEALALLLDFCKAYDSVDREFLYAVLLWLGFPPAFVAVMRALHEGTRVRFLANGFRSRWVEVTCGIRQGCPLAPLLFLLVLEALYRRIDTHPDLTGIILRSKAGTMTLKVGGYADDTASYVKSATEIAVVMAIARVFALASGLKLNEGKTLVIALNPEFPQHSINLPAPLRIQAMGQLSRYLGIQVGSCPDVEYSWDLAYRQLVTRLVLAVQKTTTVAQRSLVVSAVVIPKLLYIGRHQWPTVAIVERLQRCIHNYIWHAQFTPRRVTGKAWLSDTVAALPRAQGGVAAPSLRTELLAMAANTVASWALSSTPAQLIVGDILGAPHGPAETRHLMVAPTLIPSRRTGVRWGFSLWDTGLTVCGVHGGMTMDEDKAHMVQGLHCLTYFGDGCELIWAGRSAVLGTAALTGPFSRRCEAVEAKRHGNFCGEWVPYLVLKTLRLYDPDGHVVNPNTRYRLLCQNGYLIKDVMHWRWTRTGDITVTALAGRLTTGLRRQLGHLMRLLVLNFPQLLRRGPRGDVHGGRVRYHTADVEHQHIQRSLTPEGLLQPLRVSGQNPTEGIPVRSHKELEHHMQSAVGEATMVQHVHPHPRLARMVCLWAGSRRAAISRQYFKKQLQKQDRARGKRLRDRATGKWAAHSADAAAGLEMLHWRSVRRVVGLTPWGAQLLHRLKLHALSTYDPVSAGLHCPHVQCITAGRVDLRHVFWECPAAEALRSMLLARWASAGLHLDNAEQAIFSLSLGKVPPDILAATGRSIADCLDGTIGLLGDVVERITDQCWSIGAALYFHCVWRWRVAHFDQHNDITQAHHEAGFAARLRSAHATIIAANFNGRAGVAMAKVGRIIGAMLGGNWTGSPETALRGEHVYLLFHAGRNCVDTGAGVSGAMVARAHKITGRFQILYMGGTLYDGKMVGGHRATHLGLLKGLRTCKRYGWASARVVGDNKVALRQHESRTPPRKAALKACFWAARRTADAVGVVGWSAHPRDRNRTVHEIIRVVMTTQKELEWAASDDGRGRGRWTAVQTFAANDVRFWLTETEKTDTAEFAAVTV